MNKVYRVGGAIAICVILSSAGFITGKESKHIVSNAKTTGSTGLKNTIRGYFANLSNGDPSGADKYLSGVAKTNFDRFSSKELSKENVQYTIISLNQSNKIASAELEVSSTTQDQHQIITLFKSGGQWKIIDIQYEPWRIYDTTEKRSAVPSVVESVVNDFITQSANGNIKGALDDLTGQAYNQTAQLANGQTNQPKVQVTPVQFKNQTMWDGSHCGIEAIYKTTFSGKTMSHDEWFSFVKVGGVWKIEEVLSI